MEAGAGPSWSGRSFEGLCVLIFIADSSSSFSGLAKVLWMLLEAAACWNPLVSW